MNDTRRPRLGLIYARAQNGIIGKNNQLPWRLPEDLAHFKRTTLGSPVIMGRKTWDSIPPRFRPLPGRANIVITRDSQWNAEGAVRANDLVSAIAAAGDSDNAWVIGGAQIYALALPQADIVVVTEIERDFDGDAFAPELGSEWVETARDPHKSADGMAFAFVTYERSQ